eukprot:7008329-Prymnesium_polylepis.1
MSLLPSPVRTTARLGDDPCDDAMSDGELSDGDIESPPLLRSPEGSPPVSCPPSPPASVAGPASPAPKPGRRKAVYTPPPFFLQLLAMIYKVALKKVRRRTALLAEVGMAFFNPMILILIVSPLITDIRSPALCTGQPNNKCPALEALPVNATLFPTMPPGGFNCSAAQPQSTLLYAPNSAAHAHVMADLKLMLRTPSLCLEGFADEDALKVSAPPPPPGAASLARRAVPSVEVTPRCCRRRPAPLLPFSPFLSALSRRPFSP